MDVDPQVLAAGRHGPGVGRGVRRVFPVVSVRDLLESAELLHLSADDGKTGAGSSGDNGSVRENSQALAVFGGQLTDGHNLPVVEPDDLPAVQQCVPPPST